MRGRAIATGQQTEGRRAEGERERERERESESESAPSLSGS